MEHRSTPPPKEASTIELLAGDLLCTHAQNLLRELAHANWEPAVKLQEAIELYSEVRLGIAMARGADEILREIDEKDPQRCNVNDWPPAPETERSVRT
jgi:hypothetical protein